MRRLLTPVLGLSMVLSMALAGNAIAARHSAPAHKSGMVHLSLCSSGPLSNPPTAVLWQGAQNGVNIALTQLKSKLKKAHVVLTYPKSQRLDDGDPSQPGGYSTDKEGQNGITCLGGKTAGTIGYIGTLNSGAALVSEPELNKAHMVMISPSNTNPDLTSPKPIAGVGGRKAQEPCSTKATDSCPASNKIPWVTFYRTVTTDKLQGPTGAIYAHKALHEKSFYAVNDATLYGIGLEQYFTKKAKALGMSEKGNSQITGNGSNIATIAQQIVNANPDMVYCGCNPNVPTLPRDLRQDGYTKVFMGGDALVNGAWLTNSGAGPGAVNNTSTSVGPDISTAAKFFVKLYKKDFGSFYSSHGVQPYDATAYDAATALIMSIIDAGKSGKLKPITNSTSQMKDRTLVVKYMHKQHFKGATGTTKFDANGDTHNKIVSVYATTGSAGSLSWTFKKQYLVSGSPT